MIYDWVLALPDFVDDPQLVNDDLLQAIYQEWYEERLQSELHANRPADTG
jgi:FeS assembly protein IscX